MESSTSPIAPTLAYKMHSLPNCNADDFMYWHYNICSISTLRYYNINSIVYYIHCQLFKCICYKQNETCRYKQNLPLDSSRDSFNLKQSINLTIKFVHKQHSILNTIHTKGTN